ncbi:hypothetical protein COEX109129_27530 [Corallococcus exiguus]
MTLSGLSWCGKRTLGLQSMLALTEYGLAPFALQSYGLSESP